MAEDEDARPEAERAIRDHLAAGRTSAAATEGLRLYGAEIYGLLVGLCRGRAEADDVFSLFAERLWRSFDRFEQKCSVRTWAYLVARRAAHDQRRKARRPEVGLSEAPDVSQMAARIRTETAAYRRTETKDRIAELREALPEDDRLLLVLRVDRELAWDDLARVFLATAESSPAPEDVKRESARLRKRFQLVKERLLEMGKREGLFER